MHRQRQKGPAFELKWSSFVPTPYALGNVVSPSIVQDTPNPRETREANPDPVQREHVSKAETTAALR